MSARPPQGASRRRALALAAILSLLMPGLGHVYIGRFARSLIWFGGSLLIAAILRGGDLAMWVPIAMFTVVGLAAAGDAWLMIRFRVREG
ncbi:MAG: hypothetical protein AB1416_08845 [Actinomycetota bacterium]